MKNHSISILIPITLILTAVSATLSLLLKSIYANEVLFMISKCRVIDIVLLSIVLPAGFLLYVLIKKGVFWAKPLLLSVMTYLIFFIGFNAFSLQLNPLLVYTWPS